MQPYEIEISAVGRDGIDVIKEFINDSLRNDLRLDTTDTTNIYVSCNSWLGNWQKAMEKKKTGQNDSSSRRRSVRKISERCTIVFVFIRVVCEAWYTVPPWILIVWPSWYRENFILSSFSERAGCR